jgi:hypothetical protein
MEYELGDVGSEGGPLMQRRLLRRSAGDNGIEGMINDKI